MFFLSHLLCANTTSGFVDCLIPQLGCLIKIICKTVSIVVSDSLKQIFETGANISFLLSSE